MGNIIEFVSNNYGWFLTITIFLLFSLIGYIYDNRKNKNTPIEKKKDDKQIDENYLEQLKIEEGKSLQDYVNSSNEHGAPASNGNTEAQNAMPSPEVQGAPEVPPVSNESNNN